MSNLVIVALPAEDDYVWKVSSEKVPHLTILFLGENTESKNVGKIQEFLEHAAETSLTPFYLDVDYRGVLGDDEADVLFFQKRWDYKTVADFRTQLLQNDSIKMAYLSAEQHEEWLPHLTMGYPDTPAKPDKRDYGIACVRFDRVALWVGDYEGPEFRLSHDYSEEAYMSDDVDDIARSIVHYGVKGMRWGRRKDRSPVDTRTSHTPGKKVKATGGENQPAHPDAVKAAASKQKAKKSTTDALGNQELQELVTRLNLEQQYTRLANPPKSEGKKFLENELRQIGKQEAKKLFAKQMAKKAAVAAALA